MRYRDARWYRIANGIGPDEAKRIDGLALGGTPKDEIARCIADWATAWARSVDASACLRWYAEDPRRLALADRARANADDTLAALYEGRYIAYVEAARKLLALREVELSLEPY